MSGGELPATYPEFQDNDNEHAHAEAQSHRTHGLQKDSNGNTGFGNISFSKLTELPNYTDLQRSLIPQHLLERKVPVRSSWLPNLGISDALQKAKERGEQITNERRMAQGLPPIGSRPATSGLNRNAPSTNTAGETDKINGYLAPLEGPLPPSIWTMRGKPEIPTAPTPQVEPEVEPPEVQIDEHPDVKPASTRQIIPEVAVEFQKNDKPITKTKATSEVNETIDVEAAAKSEAKPTVNKVEGKPVGMSAVKPEAKPTDKAEVNPDGKLAVKSAVKPMVVAAAKPADKIAVNPDAKPVKPAVKLAVRPAAKKELKAEAKPSVKSRVNAKPEVKGEVKPDAKPVVNSAVKPEAKLVVKPAVRPLAKPKVVEETTQPKSKVNVKASKSKCAEQSEPTHAYKEEPTRSAPTKKRDKAKKNEDNADVEKESQLDVEKESQHVGMPVNGTMRSIGEDLYALDAKYNGLESTHNNSYVELEKSTSLASKLISNWLGGAKKQGAEDDVSTVCSMHGRTYEGRLSALLSAGPQNLPAHELDDMSYGTTLTSMQALNDPRFLQRHSSISSMSHSVQQLNLDPEEIATKERRPWRRESELRRGSIMAGRKSELPGSTAAAAALIALELFNDSDSDDSSSDILKEKFVQRNSLQGAEYEIDEEASTNSDVLHELPSEFDRGVAPPTNFQDAWQTEGEIEDHDPSVDEVNEEQDQIEQKVVKQSMENGVLNIWGQISSTVQEKKKKKDSKLSFFAASAFPENPMETVEEAEKNKRVTNTKKDVAESKNVRDSSNVKSCKEKSEGSSVPKIRKEKLDENPVQSNRSSGESPAEGRKSKKVSKGVPEPKPPGSEIELIEKKKRKARKPKVCVVDTATATKNIIDDAEDAAGFLSHDDDREQPTSKVERARNTWSTMKPLGQVQSNPAPQPHLGTLKVVKRSSSSDKHFSSTIQAYQKQSPLNSQSSSTTQSFQKQGSLNSQSSSVDKFQLSTCQTFSKRGSMTSQTSNSTSTHLSNEGNEKHSKSTRTPSMLDRLEQQSRATTLTSLFDHKQNETGDELNTVTLGSKDTKTLIRMSSIRNTGFSSEPRPLQLIIQDASEPEENDRSHQKSSSFPAQRGRGIFGFGKKKNEHVPLDDSGSVDGVAFNNSVEDFDKPIEAPAGGFRRRLSGGGTKQVLPTMNMAKLVFGGKKHVNEKASGHDGSTQPIRRGSLGGGIQKHAPKSKTDSQALTLERDTSVNWGNLAGTSSTLKLLVMNKGASIAKKETDCDLFALREKGKTPHSFDDLPILSRDDSKFRVEGTGSDGELEFNPRRDDRCNETTGKAARPRRSSSLPRTESRNGFIRDDRALSDELFRRVAKAKMVIAKPDKSIKSKRRKSVRTGDIHDTHANRKEHGRSFDVAIMTPMSERKGTKYHRRSSGTTYDVIETPIREKKTTKKERRRPSETNDEVFDTPISVKRKEEPREAAGSTELNHIPSRKKHSEMKETEEEPSKIENSKSPNKKVGKSKINAATGGKAKGEKKSTRKPRDEPPARIRSLQSPPVLVPPQVPLALTPSLKSKDSMEKSETSVKKKRTGRRLSS